MCCSSGLPAFSTGASPAGMRADRTQKEVPMSRTHLHPASKSPARLAFEHAVDVGAQNGILQLEVAPLEMHSDAYYAHLEAVSVVLQQAQERRGVDPAPDTDALL